MPFVAELRAGWEVPSIAHYCEIFRKPFRLPEFDVDELEEAFIASGSPDGSTLLTQLFIQLLKGCYPHKGISEDSYIKCLQNVYKHNTGEESQLSDINSAEAFYTVPQKLKVELLYMLCHVRLNSSDVPDLLKGYDGDYLRLEPIGTDSSGAIYWYFDDTRLYKEDPPPPKQTPAKKKATARKMPKKQSTSAKKQDNKPKAKQQSQRHSKSLGNVANSKGDSSAKSKTEVTTRLRTRSVHNLRETRSRVTSDIQSDSSDVSPLRKRIKKEFDSPTGIQKTEPDTKNVNASDNSLTMKDAAIVDGVTPRRSSRARSTTSCYQYQYEPVKVKEEPPEQSSSDSDSDDGGVTLAQITARGDASDSGSGRWHLVCVTIEDWTALAERFHKTSVPCERKLSRRLTNDIIPLVEARYEQKEKLRRKKLLEVAPRRTSGRLEVKRHLQEEEVNRWEQRVPNPYYNGELSRRRRHEEELSWTSEEVKRKEKEEREKERERARQERMRRVELRELRATLIAQGKHVPPELFGATHQESSSESDDSSKEELMNAMERVLSLVRQRRDAWPFRHPVDEEFAPGYLALIERPMDLETMEEKLKTGAYTYRDQFVEDFGLIFANCRNYNGPNSDYTILANKLEQFVKRIIEKYLPGEAESLSSEEDEDSSDNSSSDDSDAYNQHKTTSEGRHFQPLKYIPSQKWTASLCRSSLSTAAAPPLSQPRRPCYAASYTPRKTDLHQRASTIITIRRIPESTPPTKFYASHNISRTEQQGLVGNLAGNLAGLAAEHGPGKYQIVAVPADGFITDVACMAVPTTTTQNTIVGNHQDTNQHRHVPKTVVTVDGGAQSQKTGHLTTTVKAVPTQTVSVQPMSLLTQGSGSTTQAFLSTSQNRPVVSYGAVRGQVSLAASNLIGNSAVKLTGGTPGIAGAQRVLVTHPASVTSKPHLSSATHMFTNSSQSSSASVQRTPYILPRPPVVPGHPPRQQLDRSQQKSLVNGQVTGAPRTTVVSNGQPFSKSLDKSIVPRDQCVKPEDETTVTPTLANTSSCVVTPMSTTLSNSSS